MAVTTAERNAVIARAKAANGGKMPTTSAINATVAKNRLTAAATAAAKAPAASTADLYQTATGETPGAAEKALTPGQYNTQKLMQFEGSPQLGNIDVSKGYAGDQAKAYVAWLKKVGPAGYVGVNSGKRDDREYASVLEGAQRYAAMPTGVTSDNPNLSAAETAAGRAYDAQVQTVGNAQWNSLAAALKAATPAQRAAAAPKPKAKPKAAVAKPKAAVAKPKAAVAKPKAAVAKPKPKPKPKPAAPKPKPKPFWADQPGGVSHYPG